MTHRMNMSQSGDDSGLLIDRKREGQQTSPALLFMATLIAMTSLFEILLRHLGY